MTDTRPFVYGSVAWRPGNGNVLHTSAATCGGCNSGCW